MRLMKDENGNLVEVKEYYQDRRMIIHETAEGFLVRRDNILINFRANGDQVDTCDIDTEDADDFIGTAGNLFKKPGSIITDKVAAREFFTSLERGD